MTPQIGLQWPIDKETMPHGIVIYASGEKAKQLQAAGNGHEFRLEAGRILIAEAGDYGPEAASFARSLSHCIPSPNLHRAICRLESSDKEEYDLRITLWPGNRANLDEAIRLLGNTLQSDEEAQKATVVYIGA